MGLALVLNWLLVPLIGHNCEKKLMRKILSSISVVIAGLFPLANAQLPEYATEVGTLDYSVQALELDTSAPYCYPLGINNSGTVVGYCSFVGTAQRLRGFRVSQGLFSIVVPDTAEYPPFSTIHGSWDPVQIQTIVQDVNNTETLLIEQHLTTLGIYPILRTGDINIHVNISEPPRSVYARGLDNDGRVIGSFLSISPPNVGNYTWTTGNTTLISPPPLPAAATSVNMLDINIRGEVLGSFSELNSTTNLPSFYGWVQSNGQVFRVSNPDYSNLSRQMIYPGKTNDYGDVVGYYNDVGMGRYRGFLISNGVFYPIDSGYENTILTGIANNGNLTGYALNTSPDLPTVVGLSITVKLDHDGDGLLDEWETNGYTVDGQLIDLPTMGADPNVKDIFVEVDYLADGTHSHEMSPAAADLVIDAFAQKGINLHIDGGPDFWMNKPTGQKWEQYSKSNMVSETASLKELGSWNQQPKTGAWQYDWSEFLDLKNGTSKIPANFDRAGRGRAFHYAIFAHSMGNQLNWSGVAKLPGNDFLVTLGGADWTQSTLEQAGTFMHELGHNLDLRHGGIQDLPNYKPNYFSVMNYLYQTNGLIAGGKQHVLNYSEFDSNTVPNLDETMLDEAAGLSLPASMQGYGVIWFCNVGNLRGSLNANSLIDWNCNNVVPEPPYSRDITNDNAQTKLSSFDDWKQVRFTFIGGDIGAGTDRTLPNEPATSIAESPELDAETASAIPRTYAVSVPDIEFFQATPGESYPLVFRVKNIGDLSDVYDLELLSSNGWLDYSSPAPAFISIEGHAETEVSVTVVVPADASPGQVETITLQASSRASAALSDAGRVKIFLSSDSDSGDSKASCAGLDATIVGSNSDDVIFGTSGDDVIVGLNGDDTIFGLGGNDTICGGNGEDIIEGGDGSDFIDGGRGVDIIEGGKGNDVLVGANGDDKLDGGSGSDSCDGGRGENFFSSCEDVSD